MRSRPRHVLVTGAGGFIGGHAVRLFSGLGYAVTALVRSRRTVTAQCEGVDWLEADLSRDRLCLPKDLAAIIHVAARSPYHGGQENDFVRDNVEGTARLADAAIVAGCHRMAFLSAISLYGPLTVDRIDEQTPAAPNDAYGRSKLAAERILQDRSDRLATMILRLPGVVGPGAHTPWLACCLAALRRGETVTAYNPDAPFNNVLHVDDLLAFIERVLPTMKRTDLLTLASREPQSVRNVLAEVQRAASGRGSVKFSERPARSFTISIEKARRQYGFDPADTLDVVRRFARSDSRKN